jgi:hypothetical protein
MKNLKTIFAIVFFAIVANVNAQQARVRSEIRINSNQQNIAYYQQRGAEDARYELQFKANSKSDERAFWQEQKQFEKELKKDNKRAYRVYIQSKEEVYANHYHHCDNHCHHSDAFYQHAEFYYSEYDRRNYQRNPSTISVNTQIGVRTPRVRLGIF